VPPRLAGTVGVKPFGGGYRPLGAPAASLRVISSTTLCSGQCAAWPLNERRLHPVPLISHAVTDSATGRKAWRVTAALLALAVAAAVGAAVFGWVARGSTPGGSTGLPVPSTEQPVPSSVLEAPPSGVTSVLVSAPFQSLDAATDG